MTYSVFSFDNGQLTQISSPRITSMDIDLQKYGEKGVEHLLWRINHPNEPTQEILSAISWLKENQLNGIKVRNK